MKANEAPEKLYIALNEFTEDGRTFVLDHRTDYPICTEYTRTDAFIEKAVQWLKNHYRDYMHNPTGEKLEAFFGRDMCYDFENYMKGE